MQPWLYERIFPRWKPNEALRPRSRDTHGAALYIRWLGTASHVIETSTTRVLIDPNLSRPGLRELVASRLEPDEGAIFAHVRTRVDAILCGHSHFDHLLDAPIIAKRTGAKLVGSSTTCAFGRAAGLPEEQLIEIPHHGRRLRIGDIDIRFVPSLHGRVFLGRVPFEGEVAKVDALPARAHQYRMGGAFGILLRAGGVSVYHNGSADLVDAELGGERADVLLAGLAGRRATRDYVGRLVGALAPKLIVPTHHDAFFAPLDRGVHLLPGIDLDGFVREVQSRVSAARVITTAYDEVIAVPAGDAGGGVIAE